MAAKFGSGRPPKLTPSLANAASQLNTDRVVTSKNLATSPTEVPDLTARPQRIGPAWKEALEQRRALNAAAAGKLATETFIARLTRSIADDFPDEIEELDEALDAPRDTIE